MSRHPGMTKTKKLRLTTETVRTLSEPALRQVVGGTLGSLGGSTQGSVPPSSVAPTGGGSYQFYYVNWYSY